jgi:uncharacterized protein YjbI with pentapeptide repeats
MAAKMSRALAPEGMSVAPIGICSAKNVSERLAQRWHTGVMANPEHLAKLKEGVEAWNLWRKGNRDISPDLIEADLCKMNLCLANLRYTNLGKAHLNGADLCDAKLSKANLRAVDLGGANLSGANLIRANLSDADLFKANLNDANLIGVNLRGANLFEASLHRANLSVANFTKTDLTKTELYEAVTAGTTFANIDLSRVKGLETVRHDGPSIIGIDTIYKSKGKIPHVFLRGCGVPENFIEYMASLVGTGIEFYSLFISYSTKDQEFAERLHADLQAKGVRCWFAPHDLRSGKKVHKQIDEAIRYYDKLLLILSKASMASEWVRTEIAIAHAREVEQKKEVLFPIGLCPFKAIRKWEYFDSDIGKDSAREIREYHIPNFSNWKDHDSYRQAFDQLLKDLQGKPDSPSA